MEDKKHLDDYNFHDAKLLNLDYNWKQKELKINIDAQIDYPKSNEFTKICLMLYEVCNVIIPHREEWGSSHYVNSLTVHNDTYIIEMQSGDVIVVEATTFLLEKV